MLHQIWSGMVVKTRLRITANVITDKGIRVGPENTALNFQQIVSVEEYFFLYYNSSMLKVMAMNHKGNLES